MVFVSKINTDTHHFIVYFSIEYRFINMVPSEIINLKTYTNYANAVDCTCGLIDLWTT